MFGGFGERVGFDDGSVGEVVVDDGFVIGFVDCFCGYGVGGV